MSTWMINLSDDVAEKVRQAAGGDIDAWFARLVAQTALPPASTFRLPVLPERRGPSAWTYDIATTEVSGRFRPRDAIEHLGWKPEDAVACQRCDGRVIFSKMTQQDTPPVGARRLVVDARERIRIPFAMRDAIGLDAGDRVLVATSRQTGKVLVMPVTDIDIIMGSDT